MTRTRPQAAMLGVVAASLLLGASTPSRASPRGLQPVWLTAQELLCASEGQWCAPERMEPPSAREVVARAVARQAADPRIQAAVARTELAVPAATVTVTAAPAAPARAVTPSARRAGGCLGYRC